MIEVLAPGVLTLVEDAGRPGFAAVGVGRSGTADPAALRLGNRLVGNEPGAAALEVLLGGLEVHALQTTVVALTGAVGPAWVDEAPVDHGAALRLPAGSRLRLGTAEHGLRTYVAVRGGVAVPAVLGSRSADRLSGLGPPPLAAGDVLPVGTGTRGLPELGTAAPHVGPERDVPPVPPVLPVLPGPRLDWFVPDALDVLTRAVYRVTPSSDRIALRLAGPPLPRTPRGELPSEGLVVGAVQVPPDGQPVVFGPDHPVTGGYPVLAVVRTDGLSAAAQLRPGDPVRFTLAR
ncbi:biotin-dependent carboxyltransferase family protein [Cellulomonas cellasea]|uniref:Allophanate hydrolase n=2 Tax=Cellulomonas cellasea TaxID=43670 RepID=A0A0A0B5H0_9CELL|nr:biotin-dependent carboxyltransferase family protein [Cellulomonas cellasea]KGM02095.1 allophanate hydrolase [Cellulomonas cellasea DSM 20118]GEA86463.1 allophanate hydrolase [Cellulomonas cellasea]